MDSDGILIVSPKRRLSNLVHSVLLIALPKTFRNGDGMDPSSYLYKIMTHKKNNSVGKVVAVPDDSESSAEAEVTFQLKCGTCKSVRFSDLRDAAKRERKEYEEK